MCCSSHGDPLALRSKPPSILGGVRTLSCKPLAQELLNAIKNGGVWIVVEQQSLEPSMYWGVRGAESAGFKPKADGVGVE